MAERPGKATTPNAERQSEGPDETSIGEPQNRAQGTLITRSNLLPLCPSGGEAELVNLRAAVARPRPTH